MIREMMEGLRDRATQNRYEKGSHENSILHNNWDYNRSIMKPLSLEASTGAISYPLLCSIPNFTQKQIISMSFFTIDAQELMKPSKKPKFLSARFRSHSRQSGQTNATQKRMELMLLKKEKLQNHHLRIAQRLQSLTNSIPLRGGSGNRKGNHLESQLQNASQRRSQLLAQKKKNCSERIERVRLVSRIQKRRGVLDRGVAQKRIDEKLRKSEIRRRNGLGVPGNTSSTNTVGMKQDEAAYKIQQWYRHLKFKPLVNIYTKIGITRQKMKMMGYTTALNKVTNPSLLKLARFIVLRSRKMNGSSGFGMDDKNSGKIGESRGGRNSKNPGRLLLSAFLICCYPLETIGTLTSHLTTLASTLVNILETWLQPTLDTELMYPLSTLFYTTFLEFEKVFEEWKNGNRAVVDDLVRAVCELDRVWITIRQTGRGHASVNDGGMDQWIQGIDTQFATYYKRIVEVGGPDGVQNMIKGRERVAREMGLEGEGGFELSPVVVYKPLAVQQSVMGVGQHNDGGERMDVDKAPDAEIMQQFGGLLSNERLAHELVMDPEFSLSKPRVDESTEMVKGIARKALIDTLRSELNKKQYGKSIAGIVFELKEVLIC
jgi:hypothetical protein